MPHIDLQAVSDISSVGDTSRLECDVCIVGTGPAGSTVARELSGTALRVLLLESGGFDRQERADSLNEIESVGRSRVLNQWQVRNRIVGGSSHTWTGRCAPFDEIDFERREWLPHSGWPFPLDHLTPYLERSREYLGLGVGTGFSDDRFWKLAGRSVPAQRADPKYLLPFFWQLSRDEISRRDFMRFGRHLLRRLGTNVTLVTHATVLRLHTNAAGSAVSGLDVVAPEGRVHRVHARTVLVCAGGIENARLLLASDQLVQGGLGNANDLVGRFLMDHPRDTVGVFPRVSRPLRKQFLSYRVKSATGENRFLRGFRLSPALQRAERLVNCSAFVREIIAPDDPWSAFTRLLNDRSTVRRDSLLIALHPRLFTRGLYNYFLARKGTPHKLKRLELVCMCEQAPDPNSRVRLSDQRDRHGKRISQIDWRTHEVEARTIRRMATLVAAHFSSIGKVTPQLAEWIGKGEGFPPGTFPDVAHPMGTTRMADSPQYGVVDRHGAVHGIHGLYIAGSSTFPTGGHCNPTQMIVALAIRLADTLKQRLNGRLPVAIDSATGTDG